MSLSTLRQLAKDIAESERMLKQAELDKEETINLMQQMLDHSPKVIFWKDTTGKIIGCNKSCEQLMGLSRDELVGKTITDLFNDYQVDLFSAADTIALKTGEYEYDISFKAPTGKIVEARVNVWRSNNLDGDTTGVIIFAYSMTPNGALCQQMSG